MTTKEDIRRWLGGAAARQATHMIVMCDTFDYTDYPYYCATKQDAIDRVRHSTEMTRVMEVYNMALPIEDQLAERRAYHLDP